MSVVRFIPPHVWKFRKVPDAIRYEIRDGMKWAHLKNGSWVMV